MSKEEKSLRQVCPICGHAHTEADTVFHRDFSGAASIMLFRSYDVILCPQCGFVYAGNLVRSMPAETYYSRMSKYERQGLYDAPAEKKRFAWEATFLHDFIAEDATVLDVGCSSGGLMNAMQQHGFAYVVGLEPSESNVNKIREIYGLEVYDGSIGGGPTELAGRTFDLLILNNVLEHILSLKDSIAWCLAFLPAGGRLYIEVPDLAQFDDTPDLYQQFSAEHVNYFTLQTLRALMQRMGMQIDRVVQHHGNICSLWQREAFDTKGKQRLEAYLAKADALGHRLCEKLRAIPAGTPVYLWAAGTHTAMLSQLGAFRHLKLKGVIDTNRNYSGHPAYGTKIIHPDDLHLAGETIIVSSQGAQQEIENMIKERYGEDAKVVLLYERS